MSQTWILVADSSRARILSPSDEKPTWFDEIIHYVGRAVYTGLEKSSSSPFREIAALVHPVSQLKLQELETDRGGRVKGLGSNEPYDSGHADLDHQRAEEFAREIVDYLLHAHQKQEFDDIVLVAPPKFLVVLRKQLPVSLRDRVADEINREYTFLSAQKIQEYLSNRNK